MRTLGRTPQRWNILQGNTDRLSILTDQQSFICISLKGLHGNDGAGFSAVTTAALIPYPAPFMAWEVGSLCNLTVTLLAND